MIEILAGDGIANAFNELGIDAKNTYKRVMPKDDGNYHGEAYEVWELSNEDHERLCNIPEGDWKDEWGWWRSAEGSNMDNVSRRYNINHHYIMAWDDRHLDWEKENKTLPVDDRWAEPREYKDLLEYFCEEIGASTERNVCALATDLARKNGITMGELFTKLL